MLVAAAAAVIVTSPAEAAAAATGRKDRFLDRERSQLGKAEEEWTDDRRAIDVFVVGLTRKWRSRFLGKIDVFLRPIQGSGVRMDRLTDRANNGNE